MGSAIFLLFLLLILVVVLSIVYVSSIIYYTFKMWRFRRNNTSYQEEPKYQAMEKRRKIAGISLPIFFVGFILFGSIAQREEREAENQKKVLAKIESYAGEDKAVFDRKFSELKNSMEESTAKIQAVQFTDKNKDVNMQISMLTEEEKQFFEVKFDEYKTSMDELDAKEKALIDLDVEKNRRNQELQKKYDDQKKYEEWIAWKQSEKEKAEKAELQKKYDDQKKYEEWIAWQEEEAAKKDGQEQTHVVQQSNKNGSNDGDGMLGAITSYAKGYVEGFVDEEVFIYEDRFGNSYYLVTDSKINNPVGFIFKNPGYRVTLVSRKPSLGGIAGKEVISFMKDDGEWFYSRKGGNSLGDWIRISDSPPMEELHRKSVLLPAKEK